MIWRVGNKIIVVGEGEHKGIGQLALRGPL